jgi:hypothetical protein
MTQTLLPPLTRKLHMIVGFSDTCDFLLSVSHCGKFIVASRNDQAHTVPARKLTALFFRTKLARCATASLAAPGTCTKWTAVVPQYPPRSYHILTSSTVSRQRYPDIETLQCGKVHMPKDASAHRGLMRRHQMSRAPAHVRAIRQIQSSNRIVSQLPTLLKLWI